jgi:hypothetical protein
LKKAQGVGGVLTPTRKYFSEIVMRLSPFMLLIIFVNVGLSYTLRSYPQDFSSFNIQAGVLVGFLFSAGLLNVILNVFFTVTPRRK